MKNLKIINLIILSLTVSNVFAEDKVTYDKNTKLDFEEKSVDGQFQSPDGRMVASDTNLAFDSMLEPPKNFKRELGRDAKAVR